MVLVITQISHVSIVPNIHLFSSIAFETSGTFSINQTNLNTLKYGFIVKPHLNCKCLSDNLQKNKQILVLEYDYRAMNKLD